MALIVCGVVRQVLRSSAAVPCPCRQEVHQEGRRSSDSSCKSRCRHAWWQSASPARSIAAISGPAMTLHHASTMSIRSVPALRTDPEQRVEAETALSHAPGLSAFSVDCTLPAVGNCCTSTHNAGLCKPASAALTPWSSIATLQHPHARACMSRHIRVCRLVHHVST